MNDERRRGPEEGWLTLGLVVLMALVVSWAIDDPAWVNGKGALTDGLPLCALAGVACGFIGAKVGWGRWTSHLVGAAFAGLLIPVIAGWAVLPGASVGQAFHATAEGTVQAYLDIAWLGLPFTQQEVHYVLTLGAIVWGTAQFAAYAVFGHRHPLNAVLVTGLVLLGNMALTLRDQLPYLVLFTGAALFLLIEMHAFDERTTWIRRRIGDPGTISQLYLRGGTVFIVAALLGSLVLTQRAASSPLAGAWGGVNDQLVQFSETLGRLFPVGGDLRGSGGVTFGSTARIVGRWPTDENVAFTATVPVGADPLYWRAKTYDTFVLSGWVETDVSTQAVDAGQPLLVGTAENPLTGLTRPIQVTIRPDSFVDHALLSPGTPISVDQSSSVLLTGQAGWFDGVELGSGGNDYTVQARTLRLDDKDVISGNRLRAASQDYPEEISARYTAVPDNALGPDAKDLLATILKQAPSRNPYDLALAMQAYLRDTAHFTYVTDIRDQPCTSDLSAVECFARYKHGYCLHYASTMAILLRAANPDNPIPTRLVQGFLPGTRQGATETVLNRGAHAWVEVYFPGYGWIPFDPTGTVGHPTAIPEGPPVSSASPTPRGSVNDTADPTRPLRGNTGDASGTPPTSGNRPADRTMLILLTLLLALVVVGVAAAAWLRGPRGELSPDTAWRTLARGASRLGFAPRPTQTVYEYANSLAELVPVAGADLRTVADAKVETEYARIRLGGERLRAVRDASRRLRVTLLRLVLRRRSRRRR